MVLKHFAFVYEYIWTLPSHNQQNEYTEAFNLECATEFFFLFLNQNIYCGYSKELSQWGSSFEHPKHMLTIMGKRIFPILLWIFLFI